MSSIPTISPQEAHTQLFSPDTILVDVRSPAEFRRAHADGAVNLPLDQLDADSLRSIANGFSRVFFICESGKRSKNAVEKISEADDLPSSASISGGTTAWRKASLPLFEGKGVISIERQVRIGAGSIIFAGVLLGVFVDPLWLILPGFAGFGLVVSGVTDFCGMGLFLARMPWNR
ncbi:MAG: rhodanese-like domain-containing protein [Verrucomicrobiota bacterium]